MSTVDRTQPTVGASVEVREAAEAPVLSVDSLTVGVGHREIVHGVSFSVAKGRTLGIVGESGSGKSLTVTAATGLFDAPSGWSKGTVELVDGPELVSASRARLRTVHGPRIGFVFQDPSSNLNPLLTLEEQLTEGPRRHLGISAAEARSRAVRLLADVGLPDPEERLSAYPHQLSGGQRQRVMIAIALACDPDVLIADEPTTALDVTTQRQILELVAGLQRERGTAVVWISHDLGVIGQIADDVAVMRDGEIIESGATAEVFADPQQDYTKELLAARPVLSETAAGRDRGAAGEEPVEAEPASAEIHLAVDGLSVEFTSGASAVRAVDDVSFEVPKGTTLGIVGESGSGKSTIAGVLTGLVEEATGSVRLGGDAVTGLRGAEERAMRRRIAMVFQDPTAALDPRMTVLRSVSEPLRAHGIVRGRQAIRTRCAELLASTGLDESFLDRYPHEMSGGQRQRVCIARALACGPELLILDESTASLDVSVQAKVIDLLIDVQREHGYTMLFIAHDLAVVESIADRVIVMESGRAVEQGSAAQVLSSPRSDYTKSLIAAVPPQEPVRM